MKNLVALAVALLIAQTASAFSVSLEEHFLGDGAKCASVQPIPVMIVADVTRSGEIDDSISLFMYSRLEKMHCIKVIGVASIFGNGGSTTTQVHQNLLSRLQQLKLTSWPVFFGPLRRVSFENKVGLAQVDLEALQKIASQIKAHGKVVISELGPFTISASLLKSKMISSENVIKILGVGGRAEGEHFSQSSLIPFSFRDMNVAEDRMAMKYLLRFQASKLWMVSYQTGIGKRMLTPEMVGDIGNDHLMVHAYKRAKMLKLIGYEGKIPSWDTWTTSWFLSGGSERLGCKSTNARMAHVDQGYKPTDSMQLRLMFNNDAKGSRIESCHEKLE